MTRSDDEALPIDPGEVTRLLDALARGEAQASAELLEHVHAELHRLAQRARSGERADHTLQTTALVNEAWMRLADQERVAWQNRDHFLGVAAIAMRRVLVDHARARQRNKRGGGARREPLSTEIQGREEGPELGSDVDVLALDEALEALHEHSERAARVVELRFFGGLTEEEAARLLGVTRVTVARDWRAARAWLAARMGDVEAG